MTQTNPQGLPETTVGEDLQSFAAQQAGHECERCGADEHCQAYQTDETNTISMESIEYLCNDCYRGTLSEKSISEDGIMQLLRHVDRPLITSNDVKDEFDVSGPTARNYLSNLVADGQLEKYVPADGRGQGLYFKPNYRAASRVVEGLGEYLDLTELDEGHVREFARHPYKVLSAPNEGDYYICVPKWLDFSLGHVHSRTEGWNVFLVNDIISLYDDLPDTVEEELQFPSRFNEVRLQDQDLQFSSEADAEDAFEQFDEQDAVEERVDDTTVRIKQGHEFDVIAQLLDGGNLPFSPDPVAPEDIRPVPGNLTVRDYQQEAWETFETYGQATITWPMGAGKSWFGQYVGTRIKEEKLVVVPNTTIKAQWKDNIPEDTTDEWRIETYQYLTQSEENLREVQGDDAPKLVIFDEAHHIAADRYAQLALIDADYRLGLTGSPYREDNRAEYIFALCGMPQGVDWTTLVERGIVNFPDVHVYTYNTQRQKREDLIQLADQKPGKGVVFCDSLDEGQQISDRLDIPWVHGDTPEDERLETVRQNDTVVVSSVADEGLSLPGLDWVLEYDFHGSSRMQETQRVGRLMHKDIEPDTADAGMHVVMMTRDEVEKFGNRLQAIKNEGFAIQWERRSGKSNSPVA